jgi:hypothetical protein
MHSNLSEISYAICKDLHQTWVPIRIGIVGRYFICVAQFVLDYRGYFNMTN